MIMLIVLLALEAALFSALNPLLMQSASAFGPLGVLFPIIIWGGPPVALSYLIATSD